ncbi:MAG: ATP-binding protein [Gammaproteobacteria bacterium]
MSNNFCNPFRPGAGHTPPYLAGRTSEQDEIKKLLKQTVVTQNIVLTGLRGVGKTVLLESLKPIAQEEKWLWAGADLSESASITEETLAIRILADIARITSVFIVETKKNSSMGFSSEYKNIQEPMNYEKLMDIFQNTPGLISDKLKAVLETVWGAIHSCYKDEIKGIIFAYDEAQNLTDHSAREQYPLSLLLEVFQSLQRKNIPYFLILTGLPTLFPKLVEARTYAERMFHVLFLKQLTMKDTKEAITKPIQDSESPIKFSQKAVDSIANLSGGYPYFIQFICKEVFDVWITKIHNGEVPHISEDDIIRKLDTDFFYGRWAKVTDRQGSLLRVIAGLKKDGEEFSVQDAVIASKKLLKKPFGSSHVNQMLLALSHSGLIYKNRFGKYSFAVPLLGEYILRQLSIEHGIE